MVADHAAAVSRHIHCGLRKRCRSGFPGGCVSEVVHPVSPEGRVPPVVPIRDRSSQYRTLYGTSSVLISIRAPPFSNALSVPDNVLYQVFIIMPDSDRNARVLSTDRGPPPK